jgi:septum formation protein
MTRITRITSATPLVLGSASPRRREMVGLLGIPFVVRSASIDEALHPHETPAAYLERIAQGKLDAVRESKGLGAAAAVLAADTIVVAEGGIILGKPSNEDDGALMIERLAGASHEVSTRFVLSSAAPGAPIAHAETVTTRVTFRALSSGEARQYAATGEGNDKAGGYAVQGRAGAFIERIDGSYTSVVGLPLSELVSALRRLGWW